VNIELLVVQDCPHEAAAASLLLRAIQDVDLGEVKVITTTVRTQREAERWGFVGSPTFRLNGRDLFAQPGAFPALACRIYETSTGLAGVPGLDSLSSALKEAAAAS
jgi:hypothetical protein